MAVQFLIGVNTEEEILSNPPPQYRHLNLIYTLFAIRVGATAYPASFWCDFAGVWLFQWCRAVWKLSRRQARYARLTFWHTYEFWLRRTAKCWWKVSLVERTPNQKTIVEEALVIPERVEAALLTACQKLLTGARRAGVWTADCVALQAFLNDPEGYLDGLESGRISPPRFLSLLVGVPAGPDPSTMGLGRKPATPQNSVQVSRRSESMLPKPPEQRRFGAMPIFCPRCTAILQPWRENQAQQMCPHCRCEIRAS
jgi:hypothetical protein